MSILRVYDTHMIHISFINRELDYIHGLFEIEKCYFEFFV